MIMTNTHPIQNSIRPLGTHYLQAISKLTASGLKNKAISLCENVL